jgi:hypothetical protein
MKRSSSSSSSSTRIRSSKVIQDKQGTTVALMELSLEKKTVLFTHEFLSTSIINAI